MKTAELTGASLDWAVANCEGFDYLNHQNLARITTSAHAWHPSCNWSQGGPIIELEGISIECHLEGTQWFATNYWGEYESSGPTALVAAMRCYVASKLGETVEVPSELTGA